MWQVFLLSPPFRESSYAGGRQPWWLGPGPWWAICSMPWRALAPIRRSRVMGRIHSCLLSHRGRIMRGLCLGGRSRQPGRRELLRLAGGVVSCSKVWGGRSSRHAIIVLGGCGRLGSGIQHNGVLLMVLVPGRRGRCLRVGRSHRCMGRGARTSSRFRLRWSTVAIAWDRSTQARVEVGEGLHPGIRGRSTPCGKGAGSQVFHCVRPTAGFHCRLEMLY